MAKRRPSGDGRTELTTGLRRGEICGLMWTDFDEKKGALEVRRTIHEEP